jgi:hypothetical protein
MSQDDFHRDDSGAPPATREQTRMIGVYAELGVVEIWGRKRTGEFKAPYAQIAWRAWLVSIGWQRESLRSRIRMVLEESAARAVVYRPTSAMGKTESLVREG